MLLLLGYTQAFAHLHREDLSAFRYEKKSQHIQAPTGKAIEVAGDYFEEETKRNVVKTYSRSDLGTDLFYAHVPSEFFFHQLEFISSLGKYDSRLATLRASLFRVLRL